MTTYVVRLVDGSEITATAPHHLVACVWARMETGKDVLDWRPLPPEAAA